MLKPVSILRRWFTFKGRLSRRDFRVQGAVALAVYAVFYVLLGIVEIDHRPTMLAVNLAISAYFFLAIASLTARRLRDAGQSPWWVLPGFAFGGLLLLIGYCLLGGSKAQPGQPTPAT